MSDEVKRYDICGVEKNLESGECIQYEHYEKLLAKYNGLLNWAHKHNLTKVMEADMAKKDYDRGV